MQRNRVGYIYLKKDLKENIKKNSKTDLEATKIKRYTFKEGSSIGRIASRLVKEMILQQQSKKYLVYMIPDPSSLTFSASPQFLLKKYKLKFSVGHKHAGPFYKKNVFSFFKLMLRTMMKYKCKHKNVFRKIYVCDMETYNKYNKSDTLEIKCKTNDFKNFSLAKLIDSL